jgi:CheY-like chemotaxis protein
MDAQGPNALIEVLKALTPLAWPAILALCLWKLFPELKKIMESRGFTVKIAGSELSVQAATDQVATQIEDLQKQVLLLRSATGTANSQQEIEAPELVQGALDQEPVGGEQPAILWVDDKPDGNAFEVAQLEQRGFQIDKAGSTDEGIGLIRTGRVYSAIISDMGRREGLGYRRDAGLLLLDEVRKSGLDVPFMVYSSRRYAAQNNAAVRSHGGDGATASPVELMEWINRRVLNKH